MKKALLLALLVSCITFSQAQTLSFSYNYQTIAEGDTVILQAGANNEFQFKPTIHNNEFFNLICIVECEKLNTTSSEIVSVCTIVCKDGYVSVPFPIAGNSTYSDTDIEFDVPEDAPMGLFRVTVYDTNNRNSQATMYIKMYNKNGNVGIDELNSELTLTAYPNPASSLVTVNYSNADNHSTLALYNMTGRKVREIALGNNEGSVQLDLSNLPAGIYMYGIESNNRISNLKKLIKK